MHESVLDSWNSCSNRSLITNLYPYRFSNKRKDTRSSRVEPWKMIKMKQKSLITYLTLTSLLCASLAYADVVYTAEQSVSPEGDYDCESLSYAIERAETYLDRVKKMLEEYSLTYSEDLLIAPQLEELKATLDTAEQYLADATIALEDGECNQAAKNRTAARNLMDRAKGILNSIIKEHKVQRAEKFIGQFQSRLNSIQDKVDQLALRLGTSNTNRIKSQIGNAFRQVRNLEGTVTSGNVNDVIKGLRRAIGQVDKEVDDIDDEEVATTIKNLNRYHAKISVFNQTQAMLQRKGVNTDVLRTHIQNADSLFNQYKNNVNDDDLGLDVILNNAREAVRDLRKSWINKGNNISGNGNNGN